MDNSNSMYEGNHIAAPREHGDDNPHNEVRELSQAMFPNEAFALSPPEEGREDDEAVEALPQPFSIADDIDFESLGLNDIFNAARSTPPHEDFHPLPDPHFDEPDDYPAGPIFPDGHVHPLPDFWPEAPANEADESEDEAPEGNQSPFDDPLAEDLDPAQWETVYGLSTKPGWWHYWEERNPHLLRNLPANNDDADAVQRAYEQNVAPYDDFGQPLNEQVPHEDNLLPPARPHEEHHDIDQMPNEPDVPADAPDDAPQEDIPPPDAPDGPPREEEHPPPEEQFTPEELRWLRRFDELHEYYGSRVLAAIPFAIKLAYMRSRQVGHDFAAPDLVDGQWIQSSHVRRIVRDGFTISPNLNLRGPCPRPLRLRTDHERSYINALVRDGIIVHGSPVFSCPHFFLITPKKTRLIFDGRPLNAACMKPPRFNMKSHKTVENLARKYSWHASIDLKNMFFSIKIAPQCQQYFGLRTDQGDYLYTRLPFGFSWSPFIAHIVVDEICKRLLEDGYVCTHFLDDFNIFGNSYIEVLETLKETIRRLELAGFRINHEKSTPPAQRFVTLGVGYDLVHKTSFIPSKVFDALHLADDIYAASPKKAISKRQICSFIGSLVFCNFAAPGSLALLQPLLAFVRNDPWDRLYSYASVRRFVVTTIERYERLPPIPFQQLGPSPQQIYTDATNRQLGIVFNDRSAALAIPHTRIYEAEALAVLWLLCLKTLPSRFQLRVDNQALAYALQKGRSNTREANLACLRLLYLRTRGHIISVKWIPTDENPADVPSRMAMGSSRIFVSP